MARKIPAKPPIQVFVKKQFQSGRRENALLRDFQQCDYLLPPNTRKALEKIID
jgi:hypothetical protein